MGEEPRSGRLQLRYQGSVQQICPSIKQWRGIISKGIVSAQCRYMCNVSKYIIGESMINTYDTKEVTVSQNHLILFSLPFAPARLSNQL